MCKLPVIILRIGNGGLREHLDIQQCNMDAELQLIPKCLQKQDILDLEIQMDFLNGEKEGDIFAQAILAK